MKLIDYFEGRLDLPFDSWRFHLLDLVQQWDKRRPGHNLIQSTTCVWDWTKNGWRLP